MAAELKILQPRTYYSNFLKDGVRPDGRKLSSFGSMCISVGCLKNASGSAMVNLRETKILCGIKVGLANPDNESPDQGFIIPNIEFPPLCSSRFKPGPPTEEAQIFSQLMVDLLKNSSLVDLSELCIIKGKLCWCLNADVVCLNYGGNVLDACVLALVVALKNTDLPKISTENDEIVTLQTTYTLNIGKLPFCSTFAVFGNTVVADPTAEEEEISDGTVSVFMKDDGTICNLYKRGSFGISEASMKQCINQSKEHCKKLALLVENVEIDVANH